VTATATAVFQHVRGGRKSNMAVYKASTVTHGMLLFWKAARNQILEQTNRIKFIHTMYWKRKSSYGRSEVEKQAVFSSEEENMTLI
jgi:hypothetical protein